MYSARQNFYCKERALFSRYVTKKLVKNGLHGRDPFGFPGVGSTENQAGLNVTALGTIQGGDDTEALARLLVGAFFQTPQAAGDRVIQVILADIVPIG